MKFMFTPCTVCRKDFFQPDEVVAFYRISAELRRIDLDGQQPWCGVHCICHRCIDVISKVRDEV